MFHYFFSDRILNCMWILFFKNNLLVEWIAVKNCNRTLIRQKINKKNNVNISNNYFLLLQTIRIDLFTIGNTYKMVAAQDNNDYRL